LRKHLILEKYFKKVRSKKEAHEIAHILEHYISEEVIRNIKKISTLKKKGISLIEFKQKNGLITDIILGIGLFERIISMGIFPGEKIKIINEIPNGIVIEVKNKKFVLGKNIAKEIKVLEYEKS
jgi:Fe2+ transport system protein FeoA